jgi:endonuclease/exonuclease/phosphatase family metal-dependent hydrolase
MARYDDSTRNAEIAALLAGLEAEPLSFIAAGDFNMSPQAVTYQEMAAKMGDSFLEAGYGLGGTWPLSDVTGFPAFILPLMRIDYVWHSSHFRAVNAEVGPRLGSDHLPVYVVLEVIP